MTFLVISWTMIAVSIGEEIDYQWAYQGNVAFFEKNEKIGLINKEGYILHPQNLILLHHLITIILQRLQLMGKLE